MTAAISAADRSLDLVISLSSWQTRYSGYLITGLAFEPRYSGTRQLIFECGITVTRSGFDFLVALQEMIWELTSPFETIARFESEHGQSLRFRRTKHFLSERKLSGSISSLL
jgi:hypothetical protein